MKKTSASAFLFLLGWSLVCYFIGLVVGWVTEDALWP